MQILAMWFSPYLDSIVYHKRVWILQLSKIYEKVCILLRRILSVYNTRIQEDTNLTCHLRNLSANFEGYRKLRLQLTGMEI
jgi:hypothetical protein